MTGGARSGKSAFAERLASAGRGAGGVPGDGRGRRRRDARPHRRAPAAPAARLADGRGDGGLARALAALGTPPGTVLLEDLGLLASNLLLGAAPARVTRRRPWRGPSRPRSTAELSGVGVSAAGRWLGPDRRHERGRAGDRAADAARAGISRSCSAGRIRPAPRAPTMSIWS